MSVSMIVILHPISTFYLWCKAFFSTFDGTRLSCSARDHDGSEVQKKLWCEFHGVLEEI
jgi:hypothetical protein